MKDNRVVTEIHISQVTAGMTVRHNGEEKTVCKNNLKYNSFWGLTLFGDFYRYGYKKVTRIQYLVPTLKGNVLR
jgi:hypothetical protein